MRRDAYHAKADLIITFWNNATMSLSSVDMLSSVVSKDEYRGVLLRIVSDDSVWTTKKCGGDPFDESVIYGKYSLKVGKLSI